MNLFNRSSRPALLCVGALMLCFGLYAHADEVQDANKLFKQKQYDQALEKVNGVLGAKPKDAQARFLKGLILIEQHKSEDAIGIFQALTEDYPDLPEPYNNLAVLYAGQGQYDKAKTALEMAVRSHPNYAKAHENLGDIYAKMASKEYERALQLDPNNSSPQAKLTIVNQLFPKNTARISAAREPITSPAASAPAASASASSAPVAAPTVSAPAKP